MVRPFLERKSGRPCAISAYGDPVDRPLQLAGINLQPEGPDDPLGKGNILAGPGDCLSEERSLERLVPNGPVAAAMVPNSGAV